MEPGASSKLEVSSSEKKLAETTAACCRTPNAEHSADIKR